MFLSCLVCSGSSCCCRCAADGALRGGYSRFDRRLCRVRRSGVFLTPRMAPAVSRIIIVDYIFWHVQSLFEEHESAHKSNVSSALLQEFDNLSLVASPRAVALWKMSIIEALTAAGVFRGGRGLIPSGSLFLFGGGLLSLTRLFLLLRPAVAGLVAVILLLLAHLFLCDFLLRLFQLA